MKLRGLVAATATLVLMAPMVATGQAEAAGGRPAPSTTAAPAPAPDPKAPFVEGEVLVGFTAQATAADRAAARRTANAVSSKRISPLSQAEKMVLAKGTTTAKAIAALSRSRGVRFAEPNYILQPAAVSNDPYYTGNNLWGMYGDATTPANTFGSHAGEAWADGYTGSSNVVIGVIDEGIQVTHPDLAGNIWTNPGETPGNGVDDDGNGYIDDVNGFDFVSNDGSVYDGTGDDHATHVAGTIGGVGGNGLGVAGVNWDVTMISGKFLGSSGGTTDNAVRAVDYFNDLKTRYGLNLVATSNSWGGGGFSQALLDAINRGGDRGILFVAAAGNSSTNNDTGSYYPTNYQCTNGGTRGWDCMISVAAIQSNGALASFSSYGATTVDIGAPGVGINSTVPDNTYASYNGTSMATPHVSGAVALCASANPSMTAQQMRAAVVESTMPTQSLAGRALNAGRLDVTALLKRCVTPAAALTGDPSGLTGTTVSTSSIRIDWTDGVTNETGYEIQRATSAGGGACGTFATIATVAANANQFWDSGRAAATEYCYRVRAFQGVSTSAWSNTATATTGSAPTGYTCTSTTSAWIDPRVAGTKYTLSDDSSVTVTLPWAFAFYGGTASSTLQIGSNGYVRFGAGAATAYTNTAIPDAADPNAYAAPWFDDLNPGVGGEIWASTIGSAPTRQYVVAWIGVPHYSVSGSALTFEVILDEATGNITYQYLDTIAGNTAYDRGISATVGIEDPTGAFGTQVSYNSASLNDGAAYRCTRVGSPLPPRVTTASLPVGTRGVAYSQTLAATGGTTPYTWSVSSGSLPAGLTLNSSTGVISGSPTAAVTSTFTVSAVDAASPAQRGSKSFTVAVAEPVTVTTTSLPDLTVGTAYSQQLAATGGTGTYSWSLASGALPAGLSLSAAGLISGTPTSGTAANFTVRATDTDGRTGTQALSIRENAPLSITTASLPAATRGVAYSQTLAASGGVTPYSWSVTAGALPDGLSLDAATGVISGTPSVSSASQSFTVGVSDASSPVRSATQALSIAVADPVSITTTSLPDGTTGVAYSETLAASGGTGTYSWAVTTGSLPSGLTLDGSTGAITGTPTAGGTSNFTVRATDGAGRTATQALSIKVTAPLAITTTSLPAATRGVAYSQTLAASGGSSPHVWALTEGVLPDGLSLDTATGVISGTPSVSSVSASFTVGVSDASAPLQSDTQALSIAVASPVAVTTATLDDGTTGAAYSQTLAASGGTETYTWAVTAGALPSGVTLNASTGVISGSPTAAGTSNFTVRATDGDSRTGTQALSIRVAAPLAITTASLPAATRGVAYSQTLAASGGATPYSWSVTTGVLPDGLSLDAATGVISGTPSSLAAPQSFTVGVGDAGSPARSATRALTIAVADPVAVTTTSLPDGTIGAAYSRTLAASGGTETYTWAVTAGALPAGLSLNTSTGVISGTPTTAATSNFTVRATDGAGRTASQAFTVVVASTPSISTATLAAATRGVAYSQTVAATGGVTPYSWAVTGGTLPDGLSIDSSTGVISGTPSVNAVSATIQVTVSDAGSPARTASRSFTLAVADPVTISTTSLPNGMVGVAYSQALAAAGGTGSYTWAVTAGSLPAGLSLNTSTGVISGTPTTAATSNFTVRATDGTGRTATQALSITVVANNLPGAFAKSSPKSNATKVSRTPTLSWAASTNATSYEYCISTTATCPAGGWVSTGTSRSVTLSTRAANTAYWWQVRAVNASGSTLANAGTWWKFTTTR